MLRSPQRGEARLPLRNHCARSKLTKPASASSKCLLLLVAQEERPLLALGSELRLPVPPVPERSPLLSVRCVKFRLSKRLRGQQDLLVALQLLPPRAVQLLAVPGLDEAVATALDEVGVWLLRLVARAPPLALLLLLSLVVDRVVEVVDLLVGTACFGSTKKKRRPSLPPPQPLVVVLLVVLVRLHRSPLVARPALLVVGVVLDSVAAVVPPPAQRVPHLPLPLRHHLRRSPNLHQRHRLLQLATMSLAVPP